MKKILLLVLLSVFCFSGVAVAKGLAVIVDKANIRSGPGTDHEVLWSVGKYYPLRVVKKSGDWYRIRDFEDDEGWVYHSLVGDLAAVIVKVPLANVRDGLGTNTRLLFQAEKGVSFKRLEKKGNWLKVQHADGEAGWIHNSLVWSP